ncbi:MAG: ABC transporter substrate-binding protein [Parvibaculum sp.]|uniref:heme/hemin ABC transporter substrate-binding protein n=1 Tax=Parvibaculum sp. TaxID=2024848 RepID=UPI0025D6C67B|nr:ABC transporter substrate-binding protein [Parvibaculum sp.]MCE9650906.1 ABC transporter substrate-binding protein [Parvibaculum sp.]
MRFGVVAVLCGVLAASPAQAEAPQRVLSVGGAVTETVYALGAGDRLVAVDSTSLYPWEKTHVLPNVGYARSLAAEGLLSMKADLMLAGPEAGPPAILDQAEKAGLRILRLHDGYTPEFAMERIEEIGKALDRRAEADALVKAMAEDIATVKAEVAAASSRPRVLFLLQAGRGAPMAGGAGSAADGMIALAGGVNAVTAFHGYKPLSPEAAVAAAPDILVMMKQSVDAIGGEDKVFALPEIAQTPAVRNRKLIVVDGLYSLGFGPRLAHAVHDLAVVFHPERKFPALPERAWAKGQ